MVDSTGRRRFMQLAGTGTALSIAGCNALQSGTETTADGTDDGGNGSGDTVAVQVQPDQQELQQQQMEVQSQVQNGNLSRQEAQQEMQRIQEELTGEVATTFENRVSDESELTIDDSLDQFGVFLVSGSPSALIGTLSYEEVSVLLSEEDYNQAKSQLQQQPGTPSE